MELQQLKYFQAIARTGSVSKAAKEFYTTQPALSKSISKLEAEIGVPLFEHRKGKIELNTYGKAFLANVDIAFSQLNNGIAELQRSYNENKDFFSLASNISGFLQDTIPYFCLEHPEIGIRQKDCATTEMIDLIKNHRATLGISCERPNDDAVTFTQLGHKKYVLAVNKENPLSKESRVKIQSLKDETFICDTSRLRLEPLRKLCQKEGFAPTVGYEIENNEIIYSLIEANRGIAILPLGLSCQLLNRHPDNHIKLLNIDADLEPGIIGIVTRKDFVYTENANIFVKFLKKRLDEEDFLIFQMGYTNF